MSGISQSPEQSFLFPINSCSARKELKNIGSQMGTAFLLSCLLQFIFLPKCLVAQQPNTDESFVLSFLQKLGPKSSKYNFSSPVCSWEGVSCDSQGHITSLIFFGLNLTGPIPENTIGKLTKLHSLDLSNNRINDFSSDFWSLGSTLKNLNLSHNQINGPLPNNLGNFGHLECLDLSGNNFSGSMPATIGSLPALQVLNLSRNSFQKEILEDITRCRSLVSIDLSSNRLNGSFPDGFGDHFPHLTVLNLARNEFIGNISELSQLKSLTHLNLSGNHFTGLVTSMSQVLLKTLDLSQNQFQGDISQVLSNSSYNWSSLIVLDLSQNRFTGELTDDFGHAQMLTHLNLAQNRFSTQSFPQLENLSSLKYLNLSKSNLTGSIPGDTALLVNLTILDLSVNHLSGQLPDISALHLQILDISRNHLSGEFPFPLIQKLPKMKTFNFSYNNFTLCASQISTKTFKALFYGSQDDCPIAVKPDLHRKKGQKHMEVIHTLAIALSSFALGLVCLAFGCRRRHRLWTMKQLSTKEDKKISGPFSFQTDSTTWVADVKSATSVPVMIFGKPLLNYTFADLLSVTSHFNRETLQAEGRFGPVYRGYLPGGTHIALKVLVHGSTMSDQEVAKELEHLGRIKHPNLVPLIGYCLAGDQRIVLYEYMENGNLQHLLHHGLPLGVPQTEYWGSDKWVDDGCDVQTSSLLSEGQISWPFRHKIALGTARALAFLHHGCFPQIIHGDVKASSVYLGTSLEPRLSGFGLSKIFGNNLADELMRRCTSGYTPPELLDGDQEGTATSKSDVYGFGVVLFELITGKRPAGDDYEDGENATLVSWVRGLVRKNQSPLAINTKIRGTGDEMQIIKALRIGYLCTADVPSKRPDMQQIVGLLKDIEPRANQENM